MTSREKFEGLKISMEIGEKAVAESASWTENQAGGWEILAKGYKQIAESLAALVEELMKGEER